MRPIVQGQSERGESCSRFQVHRIPPRNNHQGAATSTSTAAPVYVIVRSAVGVSAAPEP